MACRESNSNWDKAGAVTGVRSPAHLAREQSASGWACGIPDLKVKRAASYSAQSACDGLFWGLVLSEAHDVAT